MFDLEQKLIATYDSHVIRETLIHLDGEHRMRSAWNISSCWELPIPLQSVVISLSRGFLQDYSYILLAKSRELVMSKNFDGALELLKVLDNELQEHMKTAAKPQIFKLCKLVSWEILLVEIWQCLHAWPATNVCTYEYI